MGETETGSGFDPARMGRELSAANLGLDTTATDEQIELTRRQESAARTAAFGKMDKSIGRQPAKPKESKDEE